MKKYKINKQWNLSNIKTVEVISETAKFVTIQTDEFGFVRKHRMSKNDSYNAIFDTWKEAHTRILEIATVVQKSAVKRLNDANYELDKIKSMTDPDQQSTIETEEIINERTKA